jgi:hypothetical protein
LVRWPRTWPKGEGGLFLRQLNRIALASGPFAILKDISKVRYARIEAKRGRLIQEGRADDLLRASASYTARESYSRAMLDVASLQFQLG